MFTRSEDFEMRRPKQVAMPPFPTTTIGSFPQTNGAPASNALRSQPRLCSWLQAGLTLCCSQATGQLRRC